MQGLTSEHFSSPVLASVSGFPSRNSQRDVFWWYVPNFLQNLATDLRNTAINGVLVFLRKWQAALVFKSVLVLKSSVAL